MPIDGRFTLDASCLVKLFLDEADSPAYRRFHQHLQARSASLTAPGILQYEIGNLIARVYPDRTEAVQAHRYALEGIDLQRPEIEETYEAAGPLAFYDAAYVGHARGNRNHLVSFDGEMVEAARQAEIPTWGPLEIANADDPGFVKWLRAGSDDDRRLAAKASALATQTLAPSSFLDLDAPGLGDAASARLEARFRSFVASKAKTGKR